MGLAEKIIDQCFDGLANGQGLALDLGALPDRSPDFDPVGGQRDGSLPWLDINALDLAAVAVAVEQDGDGLDSSGSERIEQDDLVGNSNVLGAARIFAMLLVESSFVNGGLRCRLWVGHGGSPKTERARCGDRARW
ncbi:hypothetical protein ES703_98280 [subsurface metagenome]